MLERYMTSGAVRWGETHRAVGRWSRAYSVVRGLGFPCKPLRHTNPTHPPNRNPCGHPANAGVRKRPGACLAHGAQVLGPGHPVPGEPRRILHDGMMDIMSLVPCSPTIRSALLNPHDVAADGGGVRRSRPW
jgi:hypothetical protein